MGWEDFGGNKRGGSGGNKDIKMPDIKMPDLKFPNMGFPIYFILIGAILLWFLSTGFFTVQPDQVGIVLRLGKFNRQTGPGFHFKLPKPFEQVFLPKIKEVKREEIGFRIESSGPPARYRDVPQESLMLTGDENIVDIDVVIQYRILDPVDYLFNISGPKKSLHMAAEASIREVIGARKIDEALTEGKTVIEQDIKILLQEILDKYRSGLLVTLIKLQDVHPPKQVKASFKDVASAREDKNRLINEAQGYKNSMIPKARGEAASMLEDAEAYKVEKINHAKGETERFISVLKEYKKSKNVTKKRLYLETMEKILPEMEKYLYSDEGSMTPLLHLGANKPRFKRKNKK